MEAKLKSSLLCGACAMALLLAARAEGYVEIELDNGRTVVGNVYQEQEKKLIVYSPSGTVEVRRSEIRRIEEHAGNVPVDDSVPPTPEQASSPSTGYSVLPKRPSASASAADDELDPTVRDQQIARQLIFLYRDRAFAMNNKDRGAVDAISQQIEDLEAKRATPPRDIPTGRDGW